MDKKEQLDKLCNEVNFVFLLCGVLSKELDVMIKDHKDAGVKMHPLEIGMWNSIKKSLGRINYFVLDSQLKDIEYFNRSVKVIDFLIKELDSRCDDSNFKLWQFHNLLKAYPITNKHIAPTSEEELDAFSDVLGGKDVSADRYEQIHSEK